MQLQVPLRTQQASTHSIYNEEYDHIDHDQSLALALRRQAYS